MGYRISKDELANDWLYCTLIALDTCMAKHGLPLYIVGARARDVAMKLMKGDEPKRRTEDLDVAIAIENWQMFDDICLTLQGHHFKRYGNTQKFFYKGENGDMDYEVDIVPFGGVAVDEKIEWPPEGNPVMSVKCFEDVMKDAVTVAIDNVAKVKMAPLCGQFLIVRRGHFAAEFPVASEIIRNGEAYRAAQEERRKAREDYLRERKERKEREQSLLDEVKSL